MNLVAFIVGPPAAGKTQLACALLARAGELSTIKYPKWTIGENVCAIGHYTGDQFEGGDTVPYHTGEAHCEYWAENLSHMPLTIIDGNRFCSKKYPAFFSMTGAKIAVIHIDADESTLEQRREARGSKNNPGWMAGRRKMARNFANSIWPRLELDGTLTREFLTRHALAFFTEHRCEALS